MYFSIDLLAAEVVGIVISDSLSSHSTLSLLLISEVIKIMILL